jgi:hypothetical protein
VGEKIVGIDYLFGGSDDEAHNETLDFDVEIFQYPLVGTTTYQSIHNFNKTNTASNKWAHVYENEVITQTAVTEKKMVFVAFNANTAADAAFTGNPTFYGNVILKIAGPGSGSGLESLMIAGSATTGDLVAGTLVETYRTPYAFIVQDARISLTDAPTGSVVTVDFKVDGVSMFSTLLTIDATEKTSTTATIPAVLTTPSLVIPDDSEITIHVTTVGATLAGAGLKATLRGTQQ